MRAGDGSNAGVSKEYALAMLRVSVCMLLAACAIGGYLLDDSVRVASGDWDVAAE